jgi:hypothetical protein
MMRVMHLHHLSEREGLGGSCAWGMALGAGAESDRNEIGAAGECSGAGYWYLPLRG